MSSSSDNKIWIETTFEEEYQALSNTNSVNLGKFVAIFVNGGYYSTQNEVLANG